MTSAEEASLSEISRSLPDPGSRQRVKQPEMRIRLSLQHIPRTCLLGFESLAKSYFLLVGSGMSGLPGAGLTDELLSGILSLP